MIQLPVDLHLDILEVFDEAKNTDVWVNKIVKEIDKKTGSKDKPAIIKALKDLEKGSIIKTHPESKRQQKQKKLLTETGEDIVNFKNSLTTCTTNYTNLKQVIREYNFGIPDIEGSKDDNVNKNIIKSRLSNKWWNSTQIDNFDEIMRTAFRMENLYRKNIFTSMLHRYSIVINKIKYDKKIIPIIVLKIIRGIIIKEVEGILNIIEKKEIDYEYLLNSDFYFNNNKYNEIEDIPFVEIDKSVLDDLYNYYSYYPISFVKKSISTLIEDLTFSLIVLLQPNKENIEKYLDKLKQRVEDTEESVVLSRLNSKKNYSDNETVAIAIDLAFIKLRDILSEYRQIREV